MADHDSHTHASSRTPVPDDVVDVLLWRLAVDVMDVHRGDEDDRCTSLYCAGADWPCVPYRRAEVALRLAHGLSAEDEPAEPPAAPPRGAAGYGRAYPTPPYPGRSTQPTVGSSEDWFEESPVPERLSGSPAERGTAWQRPPRTRDVARSAA